VQAGDTIAGRFVIERAVAAGGMGRIYRARDLQSGELVAIKHLTRHSERALDRFLQEATVLAQIQHPGVVRYVGHGRTEQGAAYLAMEWLEGVDLSGYLRRHAGPIPAPATEGSWEGPDGPERGDGGDGAEGEGGDGGDDGHTVPTAPQELPRRAFRGASRASTGSLLRVAPRRRLSLAHALILGRRLALAVAELHRRGLVHRDIKPSNIFLPGAHLEHMKIVDLGTVWRGAGDPPGDREFLVGTPHYMAPEQARQGGLVTPATDVWAIGCVLYVCLAGRKPFTGLDPVAILTRIVVDDPVPVSEIRADVPADLAELIADCMCKDPGERPRDAAALAEAIEDIMAASAASARGSQRVRTRTPRLQLTSIERRVTCVVLVDAGAAEGASPLDHLDDLAAAVAPSGCELAALAGGSLLVTAPGTHLPTDQAARAARAALALRHADPALHLVLATGRTEGLHLVGQAVSEAAQRLRAAATGHIHLDELTASLLDTRFHIDRDARGPILAGERAQAGARTLLGKATPMVGRDRELGALLAACERSASQGRAHAVLVTGAAGMGKSRLREELVRALAARGPALEILHCQGDMASAGSPFLLLAPALRRAAGIVDGEPVGVARDKLRGRVSEVMDWRRRERVTVFLGELAGVPFPDGGNDALQAARKDRMLMGQLMQSAWEEWLRALSSSRPVAMVVEDLHWGDQPSVRLVDAALRALHDRPFLVLALARPEVHGVFPRLWEGHAVERIESIELGALPDHAARALVRFVLEVDRETTGGDGGDGAGSDALPEGLPDALPETLIDTLVRRAEGNAFFLEELIRSAAEHGAGSHLPDSVLAMVQARLDALGPEARRILRAASVFGAVFWHGGVAALSGEGKVFKLHEWLEGLVAREVMVRQPESRVAGEAEYRFRHALLRDAAYAMLTAEDRRLGHALAGAWLERAGERDGRILAEHFVRGGDPGHALPHFVRASEQALEGNDFEAVLALGERASAVAAEVAAGAGAEAAVAAALAARGRLSALQAAASYWLGDHAGSRRHGTEAAALLASGSVPWFVAVGTAMVSSARLGDLGAVDALAAAALAAPCAPDAAAEQLVCLCRVTFQLLFNGHYDRADRILDRVNALAGDAGHLDVLTRAQVHHLQSLRCALDGDVPGTLRRLTQAVDGFERAGDLRNVALERTSLAWWWGELGYLGHAVKSCEDNLRLCEQQNAQQAVTFARVNLGFLLSRTEAGQGRARRVLDQAVDECRAVGNTRLEGWAHVNLAEVAHGLGDHEAAAEAAARAVDLLVASPSLQAWALAVHARAELGRGHAAEACALAGRAVALAGRVRLIHGRSLPHLILAQALEAAGDHAAACAALGRAVDELDRRLAFLDRSSFRARFLARAEHRAIAELAAAWLGRELSGAVLDELSDGGGTATALAAFRAPGTA
jgi:eukaryotic-like serine/threonine-protein kinase